MELKEEKEFLRIYEELRKEKHRDWIELTEIALRLEDPNKVEEIMKSLRNKEILTIEKDRHSQTYVKIREVF